MTFWLAATAIPVVTALLLFRPLLRKGNAMLGLGLALILLLPITTLLLYQGVGVPEAINLPETPPAVAQDADMNELLAQLQARMEAEPGDVDGWLLLGRSYRSMQRYAEAREAFEAARALAPTEPVVAVELAEAIIFTSPPGQANPEVMPLLQEALAIDPNLQKALWLAGMVAAQVGDDASAIRYWDRLMTQLEPGSAVAAGVQEQLTAARSRLGAPNPEAWKGIEIRVVAPASLPDLTPESALFIIARDPASPNPPLGAIRLSPAFPAEARLDDANSMMPQRPISSAGDIELIARLSLDGNPLTEGQALESDAVTVSRTHDQTVELTLKAP